jgi:hypothetical protein
MKEIVIQLISNNDTLKHKINELTTLSDLKNLTNLDKAWTELGTPLIDNSVTIKDYNLFYDNIEIYFGTEWPDKVKDIIHYYEQKVQ